MKWQPMNTAPKTGEAVLLAIRYRHPKIRYFSVVARWSYDEDEWVDSYSMDPVCEAGEEAYWMELPDYPE